MNEKTRKCPLCGYKFTGTSDFCSYCSLFKKCNSARCPNCGYEIPQ